MIDIEKVKQAALAATPGDWKAVCSIPEEGFECFWLMHNDAHFGDIHGPQSGQQLADATYIATANPSAVLELITRLEAAESSNKQWEDSYHSQQEYFLERTTAMQVMLEVAEQDAARYCWLRANDPNKVMSVNTNERINKFFPNQLDESIDYHSAIKEMK